MTRYDGIVFVVVILLTGTVADQMLDGQVSPTPIARLNGENFAYVFDCAGQYVRIDLRSGTHTQPTGVPGAPPGDGGTDGCLVKALAAEPQRSVVY